MSYPCLLQPQRSSTESPLEVHPNLSLLQTQPIGGGAGGGDGLVGGGGFPPHTIVTLKTIVRKVVCKSDLEGGLLCR